MQITGTITKTESGWRFEIPALYIHTGFVEDKKLLELAIEESVTGLSELRFNETIPVKVVINEKQNTFIISSDATDILLSLMLLRQRGKAGLSLVDMQNALGQKSKGSITAYETGKIEPGISKISNWLKAVGMDIVINVEKRVDVNEKHSHEKHSKKKAS